MAVSNVIVKQKYLGDAVTTSFPIPFAFIPGDLTPIKVAVYDNILKEEILPTPSYNLSPGGDSPTAVVFTAAPAVDTTVIVYRQIPLTQVVDYIQNGAFLAESHETGLDRIVMMVQQLADQANRAIQLDLLDDGVVSPILPPLAAGTVIGVNGDGDGFVGIPNADFIGPAGQIDGLNVVGELEYDDVTPMSVANSGTPTNAVLDFVLRKGRTATIAIGTVTAVQPTDPATVTNVGTASDAVFDFEIPRGEDGVSTTLVTIEPNNPNDAIGTNGDLWINSVTGDLFQKELGTYNLKGNITGPPGGLSLANSFDIPASADSFTVLFPGPVPDVNYVPIITLENSVDADPIMFNWMVTQRTVNGFTVKLNAQTDTANYKCLWGYTPYA